MLKQSLTNAGNHPELFATEVSPQLLMLDPAGRRFPVLDASCAAPALEMADKLFMMSGAVKAVTYGVCHSRSFASVNFGDTNKEPVDCVMLYYTSFNGRPTKSEIFRAAKAIARSELRVQLREAEEAITGSRSVIFPELAPLRGAAVPFLVSTSIFYNENRLTRYFPSSDDQLAEVIKDINGRLTEGNVSVLR